MSDAPVSQHSLAVTHVTRTDNHWIMLAPLWAEVENRCKLMSLTWLELDTVCSSMVWTNNPNSGWAIFSLDYVNRAYLWGGLSHVCVHGQRLVIPLWRKKSSRVSHKCLKYDLHHYENSSIVVGSLLLWDGRLDCLLGLRGLHNQWRGILSNH